jgi:hypothetical protein
MSPVLHCGLNDIINGIEKALMKAGEIKYPTEDQVNERWEELNDPWNTDVLADEEDAFKLGVEFTKSFIEEQK